jgi:hypothetical protein
VFWACSWQRSLLSSGCRCESEMWEIEITCLLFILICESWALLSISSYSNELNRSPIIPSTIAFLKCPCRRSSTTPLWRGLYYNQQRLQNERVNSIKSHAVLTANSGTVIDNYLYSAQSRLDEPPNLLLIHWKYV